MTEPSPTASPPPDTGRSSGERTSVRRKLPAPVLASEALREDVAPLCPWDRAFRIWDAVLALLFVGVGVLVHVGVLDPNPWDPWVAYGIGVLLLLLALSPVSYMARGAGSLLLGMVVVGLGLAGVGPLAELVGSGSSAVEAATRVMAATALPAALLFRARYRAYLGARVTLLVALVFALPAALLASLSVAAGPMIASVAAGLVLAAILLSLLGFMGEGTTAASTSWAVVIVVLIGAERMAAFLWVDSGWNASQVDLQAGFMLMVACALTSKGLFQLLAAALAADARRVDVMRNRQHSLHRASAADH